MDVKWKEIFPNDVLIGKNFVDFNFKLRLSSTHNFCPP